MRGGVATNWEERIRNLELRVKRLEELIEALLALARKAADDALRNPYPESKGGAAGAQIFQAIVTTTIPARANPTAAATSGFARIQVRNKGTGNYVTHPDFPLPQKIWNGWPAPTSNPATAIAGKVVMVKYFDGEFDLIVENCS